RKLRVLAHAQIDVGLVVINLQGELALLVTDLHAALLVDLIDGELVGVFIVAARVGEWPRQLDRGAERDVRRRRCGRYEQGCGEKASRKRSADPGHCVSPWFIRYRQPGCLAPDRRTKAKVSKVQAGCRSADKTAGTLLCSRPAIIPMDDRMPCGGPAPVQVLQS